MKPYLKEIDLSKGYKSEHPDIKIDGTQYFIKYNGRYMVGTFSRVWFGLTCSSGWLSPQFDAPDYNHSQWEALWEIIDDDIDMRKIKLENLNEK